MTDTLTIGGQSITRLYMGLGLKATVPQGIYFGGVLGLGFDVKQHNITRCADAFNVCDKGDAGCHWNAVQPCIQKGVLDSLVNQMLINPRAFSLYLDDLHKY